ncbi:outer membrane lipoprotein carrier protein LolA [Bacteroidales bacterium OttesenSCG-928-I21]|nr:outer membrane lipoprotein carrier protein LolA [Bacteroidales bacterium OttesenSCG-928-I21]
MKKSIFTFIFLIGCLAMQAQTMSQSDSQLIAKIVEANKKHKTMTSDFKQTQHLSFIGDDIVSSGKFYYNKPDQLVMKYTDPAGNLMLINGDNFVMVILGKVSKSTGKSNSKLREIKAILSGCLEGNMPLFGAKKVTCKETTQYYVVTAVIDETGKSDISKVVLSYDKTDYSLAILQTIEPDDNYTIYEFNNKKFNVTIDGSVFQEPKK